MSGLDPVATNALATTDSSCPSKSFSKMPHFQDHCLEIFADFNLSKPISPPEKSLGQRIWECLSGLPVLGHILRAVAWVINKISHLIFGDPVQIPDYLKKYNDALNSPDAPLLFNELVQKAHRQLEECVKAIQGTSISSIENLEALRCNIDEFDGLIHVCDAFNHRFASKLLPNTNQMTDSVYNFANYRKEAYPKIQSFVKNHQVAFTQCIVENQKKIIATLDKVKDPNMDLMQQRNLSRHSYAAFLDLLEQAIGWQQLFKLDDSIVTAEICSNSNVILENLSRLEIPGGPDPESIADEAPVPAATAAPALPATDTPLPSLPVQLPIEGAEKEVKEKAAVAAPTPHIDEANRKFLAAIQQKGIPNIGNSCYLNSALQVLFALPNFYQKLHAPLQGVEDSIKARVELQAALKSIVQLLQEDSQQNLRLGMEKFRLKMFELSALCNVLEFENTRENRARQQDSSAALNLMMRVLGLSFVTNTSLGAIMGGGNAVQMEPYDRDEVHYMNILHIPQKKTALQTVFNETYNVQAAKNGETVTRNNVRVPYQTVTKMKASPEFLAIQLARFSFTPQGGAIKNNAPVIFPEETLNITSGLRNQNAQQTRTCVSFLVHQNAWDSSSASRGHYFAFRRGLDGKWRKYDDSHVSEVSEKEIKEYMSQSYCAIFA